MIKFTYDYLIILRQNINIEVHFTKTKQNLSNLQIFDKADPDLYPYPPPPFRLLFPFLCHIGCALRGPVASPFPGAYADPSTSRFYTWKPLEVVGYFWGFAGVSRFLIPNHQLTQKYQAMSKNMLQLKMGIFPKWGLYKDIKKYNTCFKNHHVIVVAGTNQISSPNSKNTSGLWEFIVLILISLGSQGLMLLYLIWAKLVQPTVDQHADSVEYISL